MCTCHDDIHCPAVTQENSPKVTWTGLPGLAHSVSTCEQVKPLFFVDTQPVVFCYNDGKQTKTTSQQFIHFSSCLLYGSAYPEAAVLIFLGTLCHTCWCQFPCHHLETTSYSSPSFAAGKYSGLQGPPEADGIRADHLIFGFVLLSRPLKSHLLQRKDLSKVC